MTFFKVANILVCIFVFSMVAEEIERIWKKYRRSKHE